MSEEDNNFDDDFEDEEFDEEGEEEFGDEEGAKLCIRLQDFHKIELLRIKL